MDVNQIGSRIVREIVIPELTREVNEDKNFTQLRQVYNSLILATWYKKKIKDSILEQVYAGKNKIKGVEYNKDAITNGGRSGGRTARRPQARSNGSAMNVKAPQGNNQLMLNLSTNVIFKPLKKGVYNYIKEDTGSNDKGETVPRKYFSGGAELYGCRDSNNNSQACFKWKAFR